MNHTTEDMNSAESARQPALLFVDDEENILSSMRRLFRGRPVQLATALSGAEALAYLEKHEVDVVVSDMRMPHQTGAELLSIVKDRWPSTMRIILTGYAEVDDTLAAINEGEIYRYVLKPWDDIHFISVVEGAIEVKAMRDEQARLQRLVRRQNRELADLNAVLERKVEQRTAELQAVTRQLAFANDNLKKGFVTSIKTFTSLIEMRSGSMAGHSRRVADLAKLIATQMGLVEAEAHEIMVAGLIHDVGKLVLGDHLIEVPYSQLSNTDRQEFEKHTINGQAALMAIDQLQGAAVFVRHHHERFDGKGYPDGLAEESIPLGARILSVANDFDALQIGTLEDRPLTREDAIRTIRSQSGKRYDPEVVDAFSAVINEPQAPTAKPETPARSGDLIVGMVLSRDLSTHTGMLLLAADHVLDERNIEQIQQFERSGKQPLPIFIYKPQDAEEEV
ncbi:MAG: response regulator [Burkholderiales bacterium]|nr:response regulator [Burkholderiales bacterium]